MPSHSVASSSRASLAPEPRTTARCRALASGYTRRLLVDLVVVSIGSLGLADAAWSQSTSTCSSNTRFYTQPNVHSEQDTDPDEGGMKPGLACASFVQGMVEASNPIDRAN